MTEATISIVAETTGVPGFGAIQPLDEMPGCTETIAPDLAHTTTTYIQDAIRVLMVRIDYWLLIRKKIAIAMSTSHRVFVFEFGCP